MLLVSKALFIKSFSKIILLGHKTHAKRDGIGITLVQPNYFPD